MIRQHERRDAATALTKAEREQSPIPPLTETYPNIDVADAYDIQLIQVRNKVTAGAKIRGHKVGLSSAAMQKMMGVDEPDYGHLLDTMFVYEGETIAIADLCSPKVEIEVAFVLGATLAAPGCTVADVLAATAYVCPAIEIIDSRIDNWQIKLPDTIADNASSAKVVLGANKTKVEDVNLRTLGGNLRKNGEIVETGAAGAVLSNPATAVSWLANKVHEFDVRIGAGHVVLPGACTRAIDVQPGDVISAEFDVLGSVTVRFA